MWQSPKARSQDRWQVLSLHLFTHRRELTGRLLQLIGFSAKYSSATQSVGNDDAAAITFPLLLQLSSSSLSRIEENVKFLSYKCVQRYMDDKKVILPATNNSESFNTWSRTLLYSQQQQTTINKNSNLLNNITTAASATHPTYDVCPVFQCPIHESKLHRGVVLHLAPCSRIDLRPKFGHTDDSHAARVACAGQDKDLAYCTVADSIHLVID